MFAIELSGVSKVFTGKTAVTALDGVNLNIHEGEFVSLIGPSGCGKTTLLSLVAGLIEPSAGVVRVNGDSPRRARGRHQIGMVFQTPALFPQETALANVQSSLDITGVLNGFSPSELLDEFGLGSFLRHYPGQLSGGMRQRVGIAAALVYNPAIMLCDEPFASLDELTREEMGDWLVGVMEKHRRTVLFVTHNVEEAVYLSDRVIVMSPHPGRVSQDIPISLPQPRYGELRESPAFNDIVLQVRRALRRISRGEANEATTLAKTGQGVSRDGLVSTNGMVHSEGVQPSTGV